MSFDPRLCEGCPIQGRYQPVPQTGSTSARFLVVTEIPSAQGARERRLLTPAQSDLLAQEFGQAGFGKSDFRLTPTCHCAFDPDAHTNKEKRAILSHCRQHLLNEIEANTPESVIPLGAEATTQAMGKPVKISKARGRPSYATDYSQPVFPMLAPSLVLRYPQNLPLLRADIESFGRYSDVGFDASQASSMNDSSVEYEFVEDLEFLIERNPELISFDVETTGLRWYQPGVDVRSYRQDAHEGMPWYTPRFQILTMQFCVEAGKAHMLVWDHPERPIPESRKPVIRNQLRRLLCRPEAIVIGQNLKIDNVALWTTENIRFRISGDTLMLATLLDENATEKNLDILVKRYVPEMAGYADQFNATVNKARMWETPLSKLLPYGCGDVDAAFRLFGVLEPEVAQDPKLWNHYCRVTVPGLNAFAAVETRGMDVDEQHALPEFKALMQSEVRRKKSELLAQIPTSLKQDVIAEYCKKPGNRGAQGVEKAVSLTRAGFLKEVLFTHPDGFQLTPVVFTKSTAKLKDQTLREPSVSAKDHLPYFFEECPFTAELADYVKDESLLVKSILSFEKKYIVGGKIRPTYHLFKAVTGRSASEDPNGQNIPKRGDRAKAYRKMFRAPPGYFICENDFSQAELRVAAWMSGDREMLRIYQSGGDIHVATACIVLGVTLERFLQMPSSEKKIARQKAKAVNFGFLYGMGWRKFIVYAKTQYNVVFTEAEAKRVRAGYFSKYRQLEGWHNRMREFARSRGYVRSFSGRIRHLPMIQSPDEWVRQEAERQAINSPVQEFGSSLGVMSAGRIEEEIDPQWLYIVGFVHDALVYCVKKEYVDWGMKTVKRYMETLPLSEWFGVDCPIPILADVGFGETLGDIHECEGFSLDSPFDFTTLVDKQGVPLIEVPPQMVPPNNGLRDRSAYTLPTDLEDENIGEVPTRRFRVVRGRITAPTQKRISVGIKQMAINQRARDAKLQQEREERARLRDASSRPRLRPARPRQ